MARTLTDLIGALDGVGLPMVQVQWTDGTEPPLPYIVIVPGDTNNWFADGTVNNSPVMYLVELYTRERDMALESAIQDAISGVGIGWDRASVPLPDGRAMMTRWYTTVFER